MKQVIHVCIVNDHRLFAEAIDVAAKTQETKLVFDAKLKPDELLAALQSISVDLILIDTTSEGMPAIHLVRCIREQSAEVKIIVLGLKREEDALEFIEVGVNGYLLKENSFADLLFTAEEVYKGGTPCSAKVAALAFAKLARLSSEQNHSKLAHETYLTPREKDILRLIATGLSNKEIAGQINISLPTVKNHIHNILEKLHVHRRIDAVKFVYENGLFKSAISS